MGKDYKITVNGKVFEVRITEGEITENNSPIHQTAPTEEIKREPSLQTAPVVQKKESSTVAMRTEGKKITAPMPGVILKFLVKNGTNVQKDTPIVVLEAMKMENEIVASESGVVTFTVTEGASVNAGDTIAAMQ